MTAPHFAEVFAPAYGGTWTGVTNMLLSDPGELEIVETLRGVLRAQGAFDRPVTVEVWEDDDEDESGLDDVVAAALAAAGLEEHLPSVDVHRSWTVSNGTHRVVAHLLDDVPVRFRVVDDGAALLESPPDLIEVDFLIELPAHLEPVDEEHLIDERFDYMFSWGRSFPVEGVWVEADVMSATGDVMHALYACPVALAYALTDALVARAARHGVRVTILKAQEFVYNPEDDPDL